MSSALGHVTASKWSVSNVADWLKTTLRLPQYCQHFTENHIDGSALLEITKLDLIDMGINSIGHQKAILRDIAELNEQAGNPTECGRDKRTIKLAIEGNIAAGKSTFLTILEKEINFHVVQEPVSKWQKVGGGEGDQGPTTGANLLGMFYENPNRWAYAFQTFAFVSRIHLQLQSLSLYKPPSAKPLQPQTPHNHGFGPTDIETEGIPSSPSNVNSPMSPSSSASLLSSPSTTSAHEHSPSQSFDYLASPTQTKEEAPIIQFFERSVYSDRYCFAYNGYKAGLLQPVEYNLYCDWHTWMVQAFPQLELDGIVYLRSEPQTCFQRLQKRARTEESSIPLSYLQSVHDRHEEWLVNRVHKDPVATAIDDLPLLQLQVDDDFLSDKKLQGKLLDDMHAFVDQIRARRFARALSSPQQQQKKNVTLEERHRESMMKLNF